MTFNTSSYNFGHKSIGVAIASTPRISRRKDSLAKQIDDTIKLTSHLGMHEVRDLLESYIAKGNNGQMGNL